MAEVRSEYKLDNTPSDCISAVKFVPKTSQFLLASSWDSTVRLYDVVNNKLLHHYSHSSEPVLDCVAQDTSKVFSGGLDKSLLLYDFGTESKIVVGRHDDTIRCVEYWADKNVAITGSWDSTVRVWDPRSSTSVGVYYTNDQVFTMSQKDEVLVVGTGGRKIIAWDLRNMQSHLQKRDSLLKYQSRCVRIFPDKQGFVLSSIEGRVAVEYFDPNPEIQKKKYAFKCHRVKDQGVECIHPVNAMSFHQEYNTFATGGSDGYVNVWDGFNKKRLCQFRKYPCGVSSLSFSSSGSLLAIACSYQYELDDTPSTLPEDCIFIRNVTDQEVKPVKPK